MDSPVQPFPYCCSVPRDLILSPAVTECPPKVHSPLVTQGDQWIQLQSLSLPLSPVTEADHHILQTYTSLAPPPFVIRFNANLRELQLNHEFD